MTVLGFTLLVALVSAVVGFLRVSTGLGGGVIITPVLSLPSALTSVMILAATFVSIGGAVYLLRHGSEQADYRLFHCEPSDLKSIGGILSGIRTLHGLSIIQFGLLLLVATPIVRVLFSAVAFRSPARPHLRVHRAGRSRRPASRPQGWPGPALRCRCAAGA